MKILALEKAVSGVDPHAFQPHLKQEARRVWALYQAGVVREMYFRADCHDAVLVLECSDLAEAKRALAELPLVANGLITFDFIPLVAYPGFARLFKDEVSL